MELIHPRLRIASTKRCKVTSHRVAQIHDRVSGGDSMGKTCCELCGNYSYNEELEYYECEVNLDEDEMARFLLNTFYECPYYQHNDEYKIVRRQI